MSIAEFASLVGIVFGLVAGVYFCVGSAEMKAIRISELSGSYWDHNPHIREFFVALKADYLCGGIALILAFVLQFMSAVPGELPKDQMFASTAAGALSAAAAGAALGGLLWVYRRWMISKLRSQVADQLPQDS